MALRHWDWEIGNSSWVVVSFDVSTQICNLQKLSITYIESSYINGRYFFYWKEWVNRSCCYAQAKQMFYFLARLVGFNLVLFLSVVCLLLEINLWDSVDKQKNYWVSVWSVLFVLGLDLLFFYFSFFLSFFLMIVFSVPKYIHTHIKTWVLVVSSLVFYITYRRHSLHIMQKEKSYNISMSSNMVLPSFPPNKLPIICFKI